MAKRLYRSRGDRKIAGVCGGIAEYFDIDPVFVRLAAIVPLFAGVPTPLAYVICWVVLPEGGAPEAPGPDVIDVSVVPPRRDGTMIVGVIVLMTGLLILAINLGWVDRDLFRWWRWKFLWPLVLISVGLVILIRSFRGRSAGERGGS